MKSSKLRTSNFIIRTVCYHARRSQDPMCMQPFEIVSNWHRGSYTIVITCGTRHSKLKFLVDPPADDFEPQKISQNLIQNLFIQAFSPASSWSCLKALPLDPVQKLVKFCSKIYQVIVWYLRPYTWRLISSSLPDTVHQLKQFYMTIFYSENWEL